MAKITCPRRLEELGPWTHDNDLDMYDVADNCTFCGSLHPDILMERLFDGDVALTPTDKNYKIYVENKGGKKFQRLFKPIGKDKLELEEVNETKFYFQHLSKGQMQQFIELYNDNSIDLQYPGYFYVLPFFIKKA